MFHSLTTLNDWAEKQQGHASDIFTDCFTDIKKWSGITDNTFTVGAFFNYILHRYGNVSFSDYPRLELTTLTNIWHNSNRYKFEGLYQTTVQEYNPIENYNRTEEETITNTPDLAESETQTRTPDTSETISEDISTEEGGTTETASSGDSEVTGGIAPFDSALFSNAENSVGETSGSETITHGKTLTEDNTITRTLTGTDETVTDRTKTGTDTTERETNIHGNIGVTSTQDMLRAERDIVNYNVLDVYISDWMHEFSVGVWFDCCDKSYFWR